MRGPTRARTRIPNLAIVVGIKNRDIYTYISHTYQFSQNGFSAQKICKSSCSARALRRGDAPALPRARRVPAGQVRRRHEVRAPGPGDARVVSLPEAAPVHRARPRPGPGRASAGAARRVRGRAHGM